MNIFQEGFILKRRQKNNVFTFIPAGVVLAGIIGGLMFWGTHRSGDDSVCQETVSRLKVLENTDISGTEQQIQELNQKDPGNSDTDTSEVSTDTDTLSDVEIRQAFSGSVIIGDSITESIVEYGYLDTDVVISKRGLNISAADQQISTAIKLNPSHVFMAFGSNDLELYGSNTDEFISAYTTQIQKIQDALPDIPIYINCILPITDDAIAATPDLAYYSQYNEALQNLCTEMNCTYIDNTSIVKNSTENLYEPDGEHVIKDYYPKWLTHMAQAAGLQK